MTCIFSQQKRVFNATNLNKFTSESKNIFPIFFSNSGIYIKLQYF